jgi:hypothetical protein
MALMIASPFEPWWELHDNLAHARHGGIKAGETERCTNASAQTQA